MINIEPTLKNVIAVWVITVLGLAFVIFISLIIIQSWLSQETDGVDLLWGVILLVFIEPLVFLFAIAHKLTKKRDQNNEQL